MKKDPHNYCGCKTATHAYCPKCKAIREIESRPRKPTEDPRTPSFCLSRVYTGQRIVCQACGSTVVSLYRLEAPPLRLAPPNR